MTEGPGLGITVVILTYCETVHIERCIERARPLADRIVVIDSFSTDGTPEKAQSLGAEVFQRKFTFHADQFRWGVKAAGIDSGWILRLDADEYLEPALIADIVHRLPTLDTSVTAVEMPLKVFFQGQWIRWGGYARTVLTRLWRVGAAEFEQRLMDERVIIAHGESVRLGNGALVDDNLKDIAFWTDKHNGYSTRHMVQFIDAQYGLFARNEETGRLNLQGRRKRYLRDNIYASAPLYLRAVLYFLYRYCFLLGFLDGKKGFVWHTLQGFWHMLLIDVKIAEAKRYIAAHGLDGFRQHLSQRYQINVPRPDRSQPEHGIKAAG